MSWGRRSLSINGRMILAKTFLLSQIVFPAQVFEVRKKECKKIERLIYSFVNGARTLYGPERIARNSLKAPKDKGGINGVDVESFLTTLAIKQYSKAMLKHRILRLLQHSHSATGCEISRMARLALKGNHRRFATEFSVPD